MARRKISQDPIVRVIRMHGYPTFQRALNYALAWCVVADRIGHAPTTDEYREWWNASLRTTERERAAFKKVTGLEDPTPILERARAAGLEMDDSAGVPAGVALLPFMQWKLS